MAERPLYTLYKNLKAQNYDVPDDYNKFESALTRDGKGGADNRHAIYENLKAQNFDVPSTYERFYSALFEPRSRTSSRAKGGSVPMTAADRARFSAGAASISASAQQTMNNAGRYNRLRQRKQKHQKDFGRVNLGTHQTPYGGDANNVVKDDFAYNPETGKAGAYVTSDSETAYTQNDAEQKQNLLDKYGEEWNNAVDMGIVPSELDKADPDLSDTDISMRQMERRQEWLNENQNRRSKELNESMHLQGSPFVASGGAVAPSSFNTAISNEANRLSDVEYGAYNTAKAYNQMLRTTLLQELKEQKQRNENAGWWKDKWNDVSNYFGAMFNTMLDPKLYSQGIMDAAISNNLLQVKKGMEDGTIKKGSNAGNAAQAMLGAIQQQQGEAAKQQQYGTKAYQYGDMSGRSLKFMADFASSGWRNVMTTGFTKAGEKVGEKMALGALGKWFTKNTGRVLGDIAGSAALAATNQLGSTYNNVIERYVGMNNENGGVTQDKNGDLKFNEGVSLGKAIKDGFGSATIENFSEMFGEYLPGAPKLLSKLGLSKVSSFFEKIGNNAYYKWLSNATNKSGIQGVMAEISEEEFGTALHAAWGDGDGSWSDFNVFTNPDAREKQIDTCLGMFYSVGFMQAPRTAVGAINAVQYFNIKHQVVKADKFGQVMFNDKWDEIKSKIDVTTNADLTKTVLDATRSDSMTAKQKGAVINYAMFLSKLRGFNQASDAKTKDKVEEGDTAPTLSNDLDDAYTEGYNADDADKHNIQLEQNDKANDLAAMLHITPEQLHDMADEDLEAMTGQNDKLDQAIYDYQVSTAKYQGVMDGAQDEVDMAAHQAAMETDNMTDLSRGTVRKATIKATGGLEDYEVYIISGNIATHDDGSIDVGNSDDMIIYYDPTTGRKEHADAMMFADLIEELPAADVKAQAINDAKENAIKKIAGIIDGTVEVGSQFSVTDADGTEHTYEVLADNGDGTAMITIDGNVPTELVKGENVQIPYSLVDLQQMKDMEDQKRLEAAKTEREQMEKERAEQQNQETEQTEETQPSFDFNQILNDNGNVVLADVLGKDGNTKYPNSQLFLIRDSGAKAKVMELKSDGSLVPHAVNKKDVRTATTMTLDEYKQAFTTTSMIEDNSGSIEADRGGIEVEDNTQPLSEADADNVIAQMESSAETAPDLELTPDNWTAEFGEDGILSTPIGDVKMGENQVAKLFEKGRSKEFGMIKPTLTNPDVIIEVPSHSADGNEERSSSYLFIKTFLGKNGKKVYYFKSVTIKKDGLEISISSHYDRAKRVKEALMKGKLLYRKNDGAQTEQNQPSTSVTTSQEDAAGSSESKDTNISSNGNENNESLTFEDGTPIPVDVNGEVDLSQTDASHAAEWYDTNLGEDADDWLDGEIKKAKKVLEQAKNKKVTGTKPSELVASKKEKEAAIADAQAHYDSAISIRDSLKERRIAKEENTAEGRKILIEKARRKFARLKSAVKDDAEAVAQIYKETVGTLLHRLYDGTGIDVTDTIPLTAEEYVASNLGAHSLNYEGTETSKGVKQETGLSREDFAKTQLLAADGKGTTIDNLVHSLWENRPSNLDSLDTQNIRNAMLSVITSGFKASEARNYIENLRIAQAENILEEQKKAADNATFAEENKAESEQQTETAPESEEKTGEENSDEENEKINEQTNENINAPEQTKFPDKLNEGSNTIEVPEDATDEKPLGEQRTKSPFLVRENGKQQTETESDADVEKNKVDDMKVVDNIVGEKTRKTLEKIAKIMGANIQWLYSNKQFNGKFDEKTNTIYLTLDSSITEGVQFIFGHEMTHEMRTKNPAAYDELKTLVKDMMGEDAFNSETDKMQIRYKKGGARYWNDRNAIEEEVVADQLGKWIRDTNYAHTLLLKMSHPLLARLHEIVNSFLMALHGTEFSDDMRLILRSIEQAYVKTANGQVTNSETGEDVSFSLRQKPEPKKKGIGYKVFVLKDGKLYPPMVANPNGAATPVGVWLDADAAPIAGESKTGRPQVKQGGKGTQGGSGKLAYRPGWHLGVVPYAIQFNRKDADGNKTLFPKNFVFAEVEYAADVDYQEEARQEGINPSGKYQHSLAGLKHLPTDGYYMYRTNPNPETDPWVITGAMKVNRILTRAEQAELVKNAGREPQQIQEGDIVTDDVVNSINQEIADAPKFSIKTYHGSQASFDKFDHSFMGSGEGAQAYGWGTYVSEVEGIAKAYAKQNTAKRNTEYTKAKNAYEIALADIDFHNNILDGFKKDIEYQKENIAQKQKMIDDISKYIENTDKDSEKYKDGIKTIGQMQKIIDRANKTIESTTSAMKDRQEMLDLSIKERDKAKAKLDSTEKPKRNLYSVDIPDDTGDNYLGWDEPLNAKQIGMWKNALLSAVPESDRAYYEEWADGMLENRKKENNPLTGKDAYYAIDSKYASKKTSMALSKAGFVGVKVIAQRNTGGNKYGKMNYVIFDENNAQITSHTKFSLKDIKPVGKNQFGDVYDQFKGKPKEAFDFLLKNKDGYLKGVFHRDEIGDIDLAYGSAPNPYKGKGLAHIIRKHVETLHDFPSVDDAINTITDVISNGIVKDGSIPNTYDIENGDYRVVVAADKNGNWVLTAFDYVNPTKKKKKGTATALPPSQSSDGAGAVAPNLSAAKIDNSSETTKKNGEKFSLKDEKTLAGVHNITEEKLRKALKLGGFANPSLAVIDTSKSGHDNFGEISFIAPSALLDKRTGNTGGTWITDAYTQRYPSVEREMSEKGRQKFNDWVDSLEYSATDKAEIKRQAEDALSNNNAPAWELMYLKEKGIDIKAYDSNVDYRWKEIIRDHPTAEDILNSMKTDPELNEKVTSLAKHAIIHPTWEKVSLEVRRKMYKETGVKASPINPQVRKQTKEIFERDYAPTLLNKDGSPRKKDVKKVVEDIVKEHNDTKKYDFYLSKVKASNYVNKNGLYDDYIRWQENKLDEFGTKNRIFRGYKNDGTRKYVPETLENVSKVMREEADGQTNGSEYTSFGSFIAKLASRVDSTDEMRANKDKLSSNKDKEEFYEKWESVYYDLAKSLYNDVFYGEQRLHDIVSQADPKKYAKKEYGITLSSSFMKKLDALKNAVQTELKSAYFETKYNRPLRLNEFAAAVVPDNLGEDVRKGIENAGLPMYDYDPNKEGDRSRAFNEAINSSDNIRFSLAGERGATDADKAEERTFRMDNLSVARKMEEEKKDAKAIKMATGWERGADGKWRYELPDAKIKDTMDVGGGQIVKRYEDDMLWNGGKLSKVIDAPELFKAYPQLKDVRIETDAIMNDMPSNGEYNSKTNTITIHADELKYMNGILNHEIQHVIQDIEGFAKGGSPRLVRGEVKKRFDEVTKQIRQLRAEGKEDEAKALIEKNRGLYNAYQKNDDYNSYKSLAGEVEARNVSARLNMTPEKRRNTLAESTEDVARKDQIFLGVGDVSFSLRDMADGKKSGAADMAEDLKSLNTPDEVDDAIKTAIDDMPSGWQMANKKMIHIAQALGENRKAEIAGEEPKFSLKDGSLIKAGTYFSGGGLVEEGLKGIIEPVVAVEYNEKISGVYRNNFGQHIVTADVRDVDPRELVKQIDGEVEYFHASPVCKNYSQAKSNHAEVELDKETAASTAEFINAIKPKVVTIENVKGYKDSDAMKTITDALDANGYTWDADVYNAADYGGYTNRERLIVRAVRDGKLPEKPKKMAHKSGWYEAVADIIPTLTEKKNGVANWMDIRLKADGIDWRHIDKPLYVMGSAYADGKVPHAFADELLPTLRTKSGDVIVMPDGKVYRAMGRVLARVSGVSDDYKMPFSENLSHTIIGNGIPTQLTEHVIAPLLQNTLRPTTPEDGNIKFSLRYDKFEHDLNQWKKDNNLPKDAQRPTIPQRNAGESAVDFLRRVDEYRKQMALWKTAPTYEQHLLSDDTALGEFNRELQRGSVLKRIAFQDSMLAIRKAQEAIMNEVGVDRLNMAEDAYTAENRSHGKGKNEFEEYNNEFLQPLRKAYHQMKKILGDSYDNVRIYMMAKHGLERDAQMAFKKSLEADYEDVAQRSAAYKAYKGDMNRITNDSDLEFGRVDFTTWRQRDNALRTKYSPSYMDFRYDENGIAYDYSGLSALFSGSDFEEAAHKLVRDIESSHVAEVQDLWNATNAATKKILRDGYKAGMMSKDTYQYVRDMYSHYIPLRGWDGTTADQVWDYVGGGKGAFNQTLKTAHGRTSIADDPIAYIENMAESGILLNNKNWVKQHLMLLAQNHPTSLLTLSKAWYVKSTDANGNEEWIPATPQITSQMNSNQVKAAIDAFEKKMEQMAQTGDATQQRDGLNIAYPQTHSEEREHEVRVMKDGEEYVIYVNGDPQLAQAMNNTRAHRVREIQSGKLDRAAAWLGRKMAAAYTSLSPLFIPSNYFRDLTMTLASTAIREDGRYNYLLRKNLATSWNLGFMLKDYQNGKLREKVNNGNATPKEQMFYDFMMNGGETGFVSSLDVEDLKKKFKNDLKDLDRWKANPVKVGHTIMDSIEFLNRMIEDSNRFAVYMTSIQYGRSIDEAVNDAKDVTLNFNRKGTGEYGWQMIRNLYLFINPAVQSLQTFGALAKHHPFKFTAVTASWLASGVLVPVVNAALMNLLGGDDDKDKYWKFTKWDRRNNLIMWVPFTHEYVKIPLAQEFRAFYGVGDMIASKMMGGELAEESWGQYAEDLLGQVVDMLPLDPTEYDGNIAVSLMPNAIRPVFELAFNVDFTGKPLFKDTEYNKYDPNFTKAYVGTPDWLVRASKMVNSIGNDYPDVKQNSIDAFGDPRYNLNNPAVVDHVLSSYLGGAYTMGSQVLGVLTKSLNDPKEIKVADIPLFSKFVSNPDDRPVTKKQGDEFWDMKENHDRAANTLSKLKKQAKVDGDYSLLERFYGSEEYKQYKQDDVKVKKYEEDKKKERAEESGEEYRPHKLNAEDIYKAHATPKDDFEDMKLKQLYTKLNGFKSAYDLLVDTAPSQSDGYYNTNKAAIDAIDEISLDKQEISELKKGFLDDGKDAYNAEDMKQIRELRKKILAVLEKANKVVVANQKAKAEK